MIAIAIALASKFVAGLLFVSVFASALLGQATNNSNNKLTSPHPGFSSCIKKGKQLPSLPHTQPQQRVPCLLHRLQP